MGLEHEFYLINEISDIKNFWEQRNNDDIVIDSVIISDDVIQYMSDTLEWIPSKNPALAEIPNGFGINYYGVTLFDQRSSRSLEGVFTAWRDLFKNAPNPVILTGSFATVEGAESAGSYERVVLDRDEVIHSLERIITMSERLGQGGVYVYHCGI